MRISGLSVRGRALLLMAVVAVPYSVFQVYAGVRSYRMTIRQAESEVVAVAAATAAALEQFLSMAERSTRSLAERDGADLLTPQGCAATMPTLRDAFPFFANVLAVDATGVLTCSATPQPSGESISAENRTWFRQVRDQQRFAVGRPALGPVSGTWVVAMGSPIQGADGTFQGAVAGTVDLLRFQELLAGRETRANEVLTITTNDGVVVARSIDADQWVGRPLPSGTVEVDRRGAREFVNRTADVSGLARIWGRVDLPAFGLRVYVGVPTDRLTGPTLAKLRLELVLSALALVAAFILAWQLFRGISTSMQALADGVEAAALGDAVPLPQEASPEVIQVVERLNAMLEDRKRARDSERVARDRVDHLVDNAVFGMFVATTEGRFLRVNRALTSMLGYDSEEALLATPPEAVFTDPQTLAALALASETEGVVEDLEVEWRSRDGRALRVRLNGKTLLLPSGQRALEMFVEDVTERRALEELTRHQQKMEAVGRLAGGIAHEFNNLLTVLGVNSELIRSSLEAGHPLQREATEVKEALDRARSLTRKLLAFSRKEVTEPRLVDMNAVAEGLETMLRRLVGDAVELECVLARRTGRVWVDPGHMEQILLNLVLNARDALGPQGGRVSIRTETRAGWSAPADEAGRVEPRWYTVLTVADDGPGMTQEVQQLIFEPFFTTKPPGVGTGLGLPTVYGIVTDAGGRVEVTSAAGQGATFAVWLPVATEDVDAAGAGHLPSAGRTALVASHDEPLRLLTIRSLEDAGFGALAAESAAAALDAFWGYGGPVDVLVVDPALPVMAGASLVERLRRERSSLVVLHLSDGFDTPPARDGETWVDPPFGPRTLARVLHPLLHPDGALSSQ